MNDGEVIHNDGDGDVDVVRFGRTRPRHRRWPRWSVVAGLVLAAAAVLTQLDTVLPGTADPTSRGGGHGCARGQPSSRQPGSGSPVVVRSDLGSRLLGITRPWEVVGRGRDSVVRFSPATGRVSCTGVPSLQSTGPVSFVVGPDRVLIRPWDFVPGYRVRDGRRADRLSGVFDHGPILPGPASRQVWAYADGPQYPTMRLVGGDGEPTGVTVQLPFDGLPVPDGNGYPMVVTGRGAYQVRLDGVRRITTGRVLAAGRPGWLVLECSRARGCVRVLIDRSDLSRDVLPGRTGQPPFATGLISPDASTVALYTKPVAGQSQLYLLDLTSGRSRPVPTAVNPRYPTDTLAWSPDSRWLFVATGELLAVDPRAAKVHALGLQVSSITQVAVRPGTP